MSELLGELAQDVGPVQAVEEAVAAARGVVRRILAPIGTSEVDDVLQRTRQLLWEKLEAGRFDPARGSMPAFAHGIASRLARRTLGRARPTQQLWEQPSNAPTVLDQLVDEFELTRLLDALADVLGERDWSVVVAIALDGRTMPELVAYTGLSTRTIQDVLAWARCAATALRCAFAAADQDWPVPPELSVVGCVPEQTTVRRVMPYVGGGWTSRQVHQATGLPATEARRALGRAKRLHHAITAILERGN